MLLLEVDQRVRDRYGDLEKSSPWTLVSLGRVVLDLVVVVVTMQTFLWTEIIKSRVTTNHFISLKRFCFVLFFAELKASQALDGTGDKFQSMPCCCTGGLFVQRFEVKHIPTALGIQQST